MKIVVFGAGAMGKLLEGLLTASNHEIWLFCRRREQAQAIQEKGLVFTYADGRSPQTLAVQATVDPAEAAGADLVILTVKSHQSEQSIPMLKAILGPRGVLLTLQNGIGNWELLRQSFSAEQVWAGVTAQGATNLSDHEVRYAGEGMVYIGSPAVPEDPRLSAVAEVFRNCGISAEISPAIEGRIWTKLLANAAINPLTALLEVPNGKLVEDDALSAILDQVVGEAIALAESLGVEIPVKDPRQGVREVCRKTAANRSSMLQDILAGRETEIEAINGAICRMAAEQGLAVPVNETLYRLVKAKERLKEN